MARQDPKKDLLLGGSIKLDKPKNETGLDTANSRQVNSNCMRDLQATMSAMDIIEWAQASISHNEERKHLVYYNKVVVLSACVIGKTRLFLLLSHFGCTAIVCVIHLGDTCVF